MKPLRVIVFLFSIILIISCGKNNTPLPQKDTTTNNDHPDDNPNPDDPDVDNPGDGGGGTKKPFYKVDITYGTLASLDENGQIMRLSMQIGDISIPSYKRGGNIQFRLKNVTEANVQKYENSDEYTQRLFPKNIAHFSDQDRLLTDKSLKDTSTLAYIQITDPSNKDRNGEQIVEIHYLIDIGAIADGSLGVQSFTKIGTKKYDAALTTKIYKRDDMRKL